MSKVPWISALVGVGAIALAVRSTSTGSRAKSGSDACGHCGIALGKVEEDRVYGAKEHARGTQDHPFCSYRCATASEAKRAAEQSKLSLVWRNQHAGSRVILDETCGWCGGKIRLDEHVSSPEGWDFCSARCMKKNAAEHRAEGAFDDAEHRDRERLDFEDDRE